MPKNRLEAFSDGVIAILITIMVLELKVPHGDDLSAIRPLIPVFVAYVMSFVFIGIYWNNHHHMLHVIDRVNGPILWANHHLLFWLSLVPVVTAWMGEHHTAAVPTAAYGAVLVMAAVAYTILHQAILASHGPHSRVAKLPASKGKERLSLTLYVAAVALAFVKPWVSDAIYATVAAIWLMPDKRLETFENS
jgi:uncharacterized membrane protein